MEQAQTEGERSREDESLEESSLEGEGEDPPYTVRDRTQQVSQIKNRPQRLRRKPDRWQPEEQRTRAQPRVGRVQDGTEESKTEARVQEGITTQGRAGNNLEAAPRSGQGQGERRAETAPTQDQAERFEQWSSSESEDSEAEPEDGTGYWKQ